MTQVFSHGFAAFPAFFAYNPCKAVRLGILPSSTRPRAPSPGSPQAGLELAREAALQAVEDGTKPCFAPTARKLARDRPVSEEIWWGNLLEDGSFSVFCQRTCLVLSPW